MTHQATAERIYREKLVIDKSRGRPSAPRNSHFRLPAGADYVRFAWVSDMFSGLRQSSSAWPVKPVSGYVQPVSTRTGQGYILAS